MHLIRRKKTENQESIPKKEIAVSFMETKEISLQSIFNSKRKELYCVTDCALSYPRYCVYRWIDDITVEPLTIFRNKLGQERFIKKLQSEGWKVK